MTTTDIPVRQNENDQLAISPRDAWLLAGYRIGGPTIDLGKFTSPVAVAAYDAMRSNGDRAAGLAEWAATNADGRAVIDAIFAADPTGPEPADAPPPPPRLIMHSIDEAFDAIDDIDWVVEGIFSRGSVNLLFGKPGSYKTWLLLDCLMHVAAGFSWLGRPVKRSAVMVIDEESGSRRMRRRLRQILDGHNLKRGLPFTFTSLSALNLANNPSDVGALDEQLTNLKPSLVVIDALIDVSGGADENAAGDMQKLMQNLRGLAEKHQCAIVLIHHSGKAGQYRGSSAILGAVDLALEVIAETGSVNVDIRAEKCRDVEPFALAATFKRDDIADTIDFIPTKVTPRKRRFPRSQQFVLDVLDSLGRPITVEDVQKEAVRSGLIAPGTAKNAIWDLHKLEVLKRADRGQSGQQATFERAPERVS